MHALRLPLILIAAAVVAGPAWGVDLTRVERTLKREPAYQSSPRYCLLVFGPDAATRVWLVLDGDVLYVDRDGSGDLTQKNKRVELRDGKFQVGDVREKSGALHTGLEVQLRPLRLSLSIGGTRLQFTEEGLQFTERKDKAPIVHFNGPLTLRLLGAELVADNRVIEKMKVSLGTPGRGEHTFATIGLDEIAPEALPLAELEFPGRPGKPTIPVKTTLGHCH